MTKCALDSCDKKFDETTSNCRRMYCDRSCKQKAFFKKNTREKYARINRLRRFKMTVEQFEIMLNAQDHKCPICKREAEDEGRSLSVDHDHRCCPGRDSCGACIRELLCKRCNSALGLFGDDIEVLKSAIEYLERNSGK